MSTTVLSALSNTLPEIQPENPGARLVLFGVRQMGANGLNDAAAAHAFLTAFGKDFRRPLVLLRAMMAEISSTASGPIQIAPWCCPRMTAPEAGLLEILARIRTDPRRARVLLADLLAVREAHGVFATARTLATAFADLNLPLER